MTGGRPKGRWVFHFIFISYTTDGSEIITSESASVSQLALPVISIQGHERAWVDCDEYLESDSVARICNRHISSVSRGKEVMKV